MDGPIAQDLVFAGRPFMRQHPLRRYWRAVVRFVRKQPLGAAAAVFIAVLIIVAAIPQVLAPASYDALDVSQRLNGPSPDHYFGTDQLGRDIFSRILFGARTSVIIGIGAVVLSGTIATVLGVVSAYFGGWFDTILQRFIDVWMSFPGLIFVVFIVSIFGNSRLTIITTLGLLFGMGSSRVIRGATMAIRSMSFIEAVRSTGASNSRIIVRHLVPNVFPIIIVNASVQVGAVILTESSLSFLGFGTPPPFPSWGRMLQEAQSQMQQHPYLAFFPGAAIALTVYAANMLGDALRDATDPRLRREG